MAAIEDCARAIKYLGNNNGGEEMWHHIQLTERTLQHKTDNATVGGELIKPEMIIKKLKLIYFCWNHLM